ncbi:hypothetical protein D3C75_707350 [compost metagenome]
MEPPDVCYDDYGGMYDPDLAEDSVLEYHGCEFDGYDWEKSRAEEELKFEKMWPTVDAICESLVRRPRDWKIGTHTIKHKPTGQVYWTGTGSCNPITESYSGRDAKTLFSGAQGEKIREALNARHINNPTDEQFKAMKAFGVAPVPYKPEPGFFGRLWAAIKFFPILVKFCVGYRA